MRCGDHSSSDTGSHSSLISKSETKTCEVDPSFKLPSVSFMCVKVVWFESFAANFSFLPMKNLIMSGIKSNYCLDRIEECYDYDLFLPQESIQPKRVGVDL